MEVIVELLFGLARVLVVEILFGTVFYWIGWVVCKLVTLGRYPNSLLSKKGLRKEPLIPIVGLIVCLVIFMSFIFLS